MNKLLSEGQIDRDDMWPRIVEYESKATPYIFEFGLKDLPTTPGLITIRGPRQYGKSTWLDLQIRDTIQDFGPGTAFYLSGDDLASDQELYDQLVTLSGAFTKTAPVRRIFIDEISAIKNWERAIKRAYDQGHTRDILIITTGSRAIDLIRGVERLPGRKGTFSPSNYLFLPVSYNQFRLNTHKQITRNPWIAYLLAGGAPLACNDIYQFERIPEYFIELIKDWVLGEVVRSGRSRLIFLQLMAVLYRFATTPVGYAKVAREADLANNTVAAGYLEQLSDMLCVLPQWQKDVVKDQLLFRKPAKFTFVNLAAAVAFHRGNLRYIHEFEALTRADQAVFLEWLVAQELFRRAAMNGKSDPFKMGFWKSDSNEIDFVDADGEFYEVKLGKAGPLDFAWFPKIFPSKRLNVICSTPFETNSVRGITIEQFLLEGPTRMLHKFGVDYESGQS